MLQAASGSQGDLSLANAASASAVQVSQVAAEVPIASPQMAEPQPLLHDLHAVLPPEASLQQQVAASAYEDPQIMAAEPTTAEGQGQKRSPDVLSDQDAMAACVTLFNVQQNKRSKPSPKAQAA